VAERIEKLITSVKVILGERKRLARVERKVVAALNTALGKIGYIVVPAQRAAPRRRRRRRGRPATGARRGRRQMRGRRPRGRAKRA
jgi:hypothetical protein